ncbi:hypothetical protein AM1_3552 [Acaryochloris marina MBIC11017]|uniref:Uncharacterized protein n=1 Tax=Acaryochloris marina (strain MBIC 11017) TaxID=329726 RepID=B0C290_ACAM1|nr:hypothetical protein AM1_3552 [Acaryochloris marina MBIC11017]
MDSLGAVCLTEHFKMIIQPIPDWIEVEFQKPRPLNCIKV